MPKMIPEVIDEPVCNITVSPEIVARFQRLAKRINNLGTIVQNNQTLPKKILDQWKRDADACSLILQVTILKILKTLFANRSSQP